MRRRAIDTSTVRHPGMAPVTLRRLLVVLVATLLLGFGAELQVARADDSDDPDDPDNDISTQLLLELQPGIAIETVLVRYELTLVAHFPEIETWLVEVAPGVDAEVLEDTLQEDLDIVDAESQELVEAPEGDQRSIPDLGLVLEQIDFLEQWGARTVRTDDAHRNHTGAGIVVAVLDSGVSPDAPELVGRLAGMGADFAGGNGTSAPQPDGIDNDGNGLIDEGAHHGTFVAGLIRLAAPDARILPVRVLNSEGRGTISGLARGIFYAVAQGVDVINISMGTTRESDLIEEAIELAVSRNIVIVASAGNDGLPEVRFPARQSGVIAVAAVGEQLDPAPFTNSGGEVILSAPGEAIFSSVATELGYARWEGTSFAAPFVSGAAAVLLERYPAVTPERVSELLAETSTPYPVAPQTDVGAGVLDIAALAAILRSDRDTLRFDESELGYVLRFSPVLDATHYDVVRGDLDQLRPNIEEPDDTELGSLTCLVDDRDLAGGLLVIDAELPGPGRGFFYLWRDDASDTPGYGVDDLSGERLPTSGDCLLP